MLPLKVSVPHGILHLCGRCVLLLTSARVLHLQPSEHCWHEHPVRPTLEGIRNLRLAISHLGRLHRLRRDHHRSPCLPPPPPPPPSSRLNTSQPAANRQAARPPSQLAWGPLCWLTLAAIISGSRSRHACQAVVCTAHLYGVALYYLTNWAEHRFHGVSYSRPEFLYFWVYYVGFNLPWAVVPAGEWSMPRDASFVLGRGGGRVFCGADEMQLCSMTASLRWQRLSKPWNSKALAARMPDAPALELGPISSGWMAQEVVVCRSHARTVLSQPVLFFWKQPHNSEHRYGIGLGDALLR